MRANDSGDIATTVNEFANDIFKGLDGNDNIVYSPASLATALGMTYSGTAGETAIQMASVLHLDASPTEAHEVFAGLTPRGDSGTPIFGAQCRENDGRGLLVTLVVAGSAADKSGLKPDDLIFSVNGKPVRTEEEWSKAIDSAGEVITIQSYCTKDGTVKEKEVPLTAVEYLTTANALWFQKGYPVDKVFLEQIKTGFAGFTSDVDFKKNTAQAVKTINDWVSRETNGKISDLLSSQSVS
ncbi:Protease inhibitor I4, serpin, partial [Rhodopirellula sallentina SM41]